MITSVMLRASSRYRSSSAYDNDTGAHATTSTPSASPAAQSAADTMPNAASAAFPLGVGVGSRLNPPKSTSKPAAASAKVDAIATTRRDAERAASSGTTTSQMAAKEAIPAVGTGNIVPSPVKASDDSTWALS